MKLSTYITAITLLCFAHLVRGQDVHFSQFFQAPLTVSPANTGNVIGDWRLMGNYRSQWREIQPYVTQSIGGDIQKYIGREQISGGFFIINDKSGVNLKVSKIQLSLAYHKLIDRNFFHIGVQPGFVLKSTNNGDEKYPNQLNWNTGVFDNTLPNNEANISNQLSYLDVNLGAGWNYKAKYFMPFISLAVFHINKPNESFFDNTNRLKIRNIISGGFLWYSSPKLTLAPSILLTQTSTASEFVVGSNFYFSLDRRYSIRKAIYIGCFVRQGFINLTDAAITTFGMNYKNYTAGVSYDINISELKTASNLKGALELSFIYTAPNTHIKKLQISCGF